MRLSAVLRKQGVRWTARRRSVALRRLSLHSRAETMRGHAVVVIPVLASVEQGWRYPAALGRGVPLAHRISASHCGAPQDEGAYRIERRDGEPEQGIRGVRQPSAEASRAKRLSGWAKSLVIPHAIESDPDIIAARNIVAERTQLQRELIGLSDPISNRLRGYSDDGGDP